MDPGSEGYWECLLELRECIYRYNPILYDKLIDALMKGLMSRDGKEYTIEEIESMRRSKVFSSRYDKFLPKEFHTDQQIQTNLERWINKWENWYDDRGKRVFNDVTAGRTRTQYDNVKFVLDSENATVYTEVKASANSKHGLSQWKSNRPESALEKFHELLAHYCNYGCKDEFANALLQRGWAEHNVVARHRYNCMMKRNAGEPVHHPKGLDKTPVFMDHSLLHHLNQQSESLRLGTVFQDCKVPPSCNNNEKFLKEYLFEQLERNENGRHDSVTKRCTCDLCVELIAAEPIAAIREEEVQEGDNQELFCQVIAPAEGESNNEDDAPAPQSPRPSPYASQRNFKPCMDFEPWLCEDMKEYWSKRTSGVSVRGRPPHSYNCPRNSMFNGHASTI